MLLLMRSVKKKAKSFYTENKTTILVIVGVFLLYKLRGLFGIVGTVVDTASGAVAGATADLRQSAQDATDKAAIKTINPSATPADLVKFRSDASAIAAALGHLPGSYSNMVIADSASAMSICKKYSRVLTTNVGGKAVPVMDKGKAMVRKASLQLPVLYPFYKDITGGRNLLTDLNSTFNNGTLSTYQTFWQTYIRPQ